MGKPLAQKAFTARRVQKPSRAFIRYSDDGGKTFTAARPITQEQADAPGRNLARGTADFSGGKANWNMDYRIKPTDEKYMGLTVIRIPDSWNQAGSIVPCRAGKTYTFSFWARVDELKGSRCGGVIRNCRKGEHYEYVSYDGIKTGNSLYLTYTKEWKRHTFVLRFLKDAPNAAFSVEKDRNDNTLFVCGFKVEEGETETPWSPAPEDQQRGTTPGEWMGVAFSDKGYPPFDVKEYTWSRTKGDPGKGVKSVVRYFGLSDSPAREPKSWSPKALAPTDEMPYLWAFDRITYTDGTVTDTTHAVAGAKGSQAEFHRLRTVAEIASVGTDNVLTVMLSYEIEHVRGAQVTAVAGDRKGIHVTAHTSTGEEISMTAGERNEGYYRLADYSKQESRPGVVVVELKDVADRTLDSRTVQITMEAASYVDVVGDLRTTVSQHGRNISRIEQKADSISLKVEGMKNGVRNLLKGGRLNVSFSTYGLPSAFRLKLKTDTDYTLTVCGRISEDALKKGQTLHTYVFDKDWKWSSSFVIRSTSDTLASVTFRIPADRHSPEDYYISCFPFPNQEPKGRNGEVTVSWLVLTEGTQAAASWIPAEGEDVEARMKSAGMEIKDGEITLTADRTKIRNNKGEDIAVFNEDGTVDARSVRTMPGANGLHIDIREGTFDILTADNRKGISMTVDENGFPHLVFFDGEGRAKYDLGYTGLKEIVSAYRAAYWTRRRLVDVTGRGLAAVWPKTDRGREWHEYHAAFHYVTGKLGEHAEEDGKLFELEDFAAPIPDGWYTDENLEGQFLAGGGETVDDGDPNGVPGPRVYGVKIGRTEGGRFTRKGLTVWFRVVDGRASFCDTEGKPLAVGLLQDYPFQPDI